MKKHMEQEMMLLDYILSLVYADKRIEENREFDDIEKIVDSNYLNKIISYQEQLGTIHQFIKYFVNKEYNLLHYFLMENSQICSFQELNDRLRNIEKEEIFRLLSIYLLEDEDDFHLENLVKTSLPDSYRWYITELALNFEALKFQLLDAMDQSWLWYSQVELQLRTIFENKISKEIKRLTVGEGDIYEVVFQDYVSLDDYKKTKVKYLFLVCLQKVVFYKKGNDRQIGLGVYSYDYYNYLRKLRGYDQNFREKVLKALADPTRFGILKLINDGITSNTIIAQRFEISSAAVSYQLKYLLENKLILQDSETKKYLINKRFISQVLVGIDKELYLED